MAITQQADLEVHQIGIGVIAASSGCSGGEDVVNGGRRRRRGVPEGQFPVVRWASGDRANNKSVPNETEKVANERYPFEESPPDVDLNDFLAQLRHLPSGVVNDLLRHRAWFLFSCRILSYNLLLCCCGVFVLLVWFLGPTV